jgi:cell division septal protein FtsQ
MAETGREMARRNEAREEAQQRMVSALETMMSEALAAKRANRWMFWFTAVAAVASVVGIVASIAIAYWQKASP